MERRKLLALPEAGFDGEGNSAIITEIKAEEWMSEQAVPQGMVHEVETLQLGEVDRPAFASFRGLAGIVIIKMPEVVESHRVSLFQCEGQAGGGGLPVRLLNRLLQEPWDGYQADGNDPSEEASTAGAEGQHGEKDDEGNTSVYLHNNRITFVNKFGDLWLSSCGWETNTTKSRLNAILDTFLHGASIFQKDFQWYVDDLQTPFFDGFKITR